MSARYDMPSLRQNVELLRLGCTAIANGVAHSKYIGTVPQLLQTFTGATSFVRLDIVVAPSHVVELTPTKSGSLELRVARETGQCQACGPYTALRPRQQTGSPQAVLNFPLIADAHLESLSAILLARTGQSNASRTACAKMSDAWLHYAGQCFPIGRVQLLYQPGRAVALDHEEWLCNMLLLSVMLGPTILSIAGPTLLQCALDGGLFGLPTPPALVQCASRPMNEGTVSTAAAYPGVVRAAENDLDARSSNDTAAGSFDRSCSSTAHAYAPMGDTAMLDDADDYSSDGSGDVSAASTDASGLTSDMLPHGQPPAQAVQLEYTYQLGHGFCIRPTRQSVLLSQDAEGMAALIQSMQNMTATQLANLPTELLEDVIYALREAVSGEADYITDEDGEASQTSSADSFTQAHQDGGEVSQLSPSMTCAECLPSEDRGSKELPQALRRSCRSDLSRSEGVHPPANDDGDRPSSSTLAVPHATAEDDDKLGQAGEVSQESSSLKSARSSNWMRSSSLPTACDEAATIGDDTAQAVMPATAEAVTAPCVAETATGEGPPGSSTRVDEQDEIKALEVNVSRNRDGLEYLDNSTEEQFMRFRMSLVGQVQRMFLLLLVVGLVFRTLSNSASFLQVEDCLPLVSALHTLLLLLLTWLPPQWLGGCFTMELLRALVLVSCGCVTMPLVARRANEFLVSTGMPAWHLLTGALVGFLVNGGVLRQTRYTWAKHITTVKFALTMCSGALPAMCQAFLPALPLSVSVPAVLLACVAVQWLNLAATLQGELRDRVCFEETLRHRGHQLVGDAQ